MFGLGLLLWVLTVVLTLLTRNTNLVPTAVLLGSFLVPVTFVTWAFERWRDEHLTSELIVTAFVAGGIIGVLGASVLEAYLLEPSPLLFIGVGLIEEAVKVAALALVTRSMTRRHTRDGVILGAAVGFGFAAFETSGYAFNALLTMDGLSLTNLVETQLLRGVLAPLGHGLWTAVIGGVVFHQAGPGGRLRYTWPVLWAFLGVAALHALWDSMQAVAVILTYLITGTHAPAGTGGGYLNHPTAEQAHVFTALSIGGLALVSAVGIGALLVVWRTDRGPDRVTGEPSATPR
jgi:RsiW-degrading membrane proteinase PrsW (M82 family)